MKVLIVSASMGAGHDGAAKELARRLEADGHETEVRDFLRAFPLGIGRIVRLSYEWELKFAPWSYEATYRMWYRLPSLTGPLVWLLSLLTRWRLRRWVAGADAVVSTYPLASLTLGRARQTGAVGVPVATYITDFAVHPLWTHPGIDLHMTVHPRSAAAAAAATGGPAEATGPLVSARFRGELPDRAEARRELGIDPAARVALLVAGSWGVGAVRRAFADVVATGTWTPLVVCGNNQRLYKRLSAGGIGVVMGWTDEMPTLMAAADVLLENAGGLTCMEAFAVGLPVVSYRPIAGHGRGNAREMEAAGVAALAEPGPQALLRALEASLGAAGALRRVEGKAMLAGDAARSVVELAEAPAEAPVVSIRHPLIRVTALAGTVLASLVTGVALTSVGAGIAAAHGLDVAHAPKHASSAYVAIRLNEAAADNQVVDNALAAAHVTAVVSGQMAAEAPQVVGHLSSVGVDVANGGWGQHHGHSWSWAHADVVRAGEAIRDATGTPVRTFVAGRSVDGFQLASAEWTNQRVVLSRTVITDTALPSLRAGGVYCIDARLFSVADVLQVLDQVEQQEHGTPVAPLSQLQD